MEILTLETLPKALVSLSNEVNEIKRILLEKSNEQSTQTDRWFNLKEVIEYILDRPSRATVYGWCSSGSIPVHKGGKRLRFHKPKIDSWLMKGRKLTFGWFSKRSLCTPKTSRKNSK